MTALIITLFSIAFCIALYRIRYSSLSVKNKIISGIIRFCIFILLCAAFVEPSFTITRLHDRERTIPVLLDLSASMQLFDTDTVLHRLYAQYAGAIQSRSDKKTSPLLFFGFGDTLRQLVPGEAVSFDHSRSQFPNLMTSPMLISSKKYVLISDGNWTNPSLSMNRLRDKEIYYVPLSIKKRPPHITVDASAQIRGVQTDSSMLLSVTLAGYTPRAAAIDLSVRNRQRQTYHKSLAADTGVITKTAVIPLAMQKAGTFLYEITATLPGEKPAVSTCYILCKVTAGVYTVYCYSTQPSLDRRFLSLAFDRHREWKRIQSIRPAESPDVILLFDWNSGAQELVKRYPRATLAFCGTLPAEQQSGVSITAFHPIIAPELSLPASAASDLPPPSEYIRCKMFPFTIKRTLVSIDTSASTQLFAYPVLYDAFYANRLIFVSALRGIWRWDFWTQASDRVKDSTLFSDIIITHLEELVEYNRNQALFAYPVLSPVYETDSIAFRISVPRSIAGFRDKKCGFTVVNLSRDTLFTCAVRNLFSTDKPGVTVPPLKQGTYLYTCSMVSDTGAMLYSDTLKVMADNSECTISGQNTLLLNELASPITIPEIFSKIISPPEYAGGKPDTIRQTLRINRTWLLLSIIVMLFAAEWIMRRRWKLD